MPHIAIKAAMAVSGAILFLYVVGHLAGNLQFFAGPAQINAYGRFLHSMPVVLWGVRTLLLAMVLLHIWSSVVLALRKRQARPQGYVRKKAIHSSYASRTMYWSGPILAVFVVYHLLDFTAGKVNPGFQEGEIYGNMVRGFSVPWVSAFYIIAMGMLCLHLFHGVWSMFQTLGFSHPRYSPILRRVAAAVAVLIFCGFVAIPVAVLTGLKR